ncbi:MAG: 50S ribosomal protein L1 [Anaerolineae bacterium]|jgi:large subunit ribosomal protein L1|nr:50S ribosomal protein L1 [Anaerolineae bacterium]
MGKVGKKYAAVASKVDANRLYSVKDAVELIKQVSYTTFDGTVEVHMRTSLDPRRADQALRGVVRLPNGLGKTVRVLVFAAGEAARAAQEAGADYIVNDDEGIQKILGGWTDFDVAIAVPDMMRHVGRLGRVLGPRGLMPTPKTGTVVPDDDVARVVDEAKAGRVEYRLDRTGNIHCPIGKISFSEEQLIGNLAAVMSTIRRARPAAAKGLFIRRVTLAPTMGPGIKVDAAEALAMEPA